MAQVSVTINGRVYRMACDDGQEEHLAQLARDLDERIGRLRESFGEIGDTRLTVMAALVIADELAEVKRRLMAAEEVAEKYSSIGDRVEANERAFAEAIEAAADRIEQLAHSLSGRPGPAVAMG
jgi:cell division protein ZapA